MMSRFLITVLSLGLFLASSIPVLAQKVKKEGLGYFNYQQPRASKVLDSAKYYTLHISTEEGGAFRKDIILEEMKIPAFSRIEDRNKADFMISIEELAFTFGKEKKKNISGGKDGATSHYYAGSIEYHYLLKVLNNNGEEIYRKIAKGSVNTRGRSSTSLTDAHRNYVKDKNTFKENCAKEAAKFFEISFNEEFTDVAKTIHLRAAYIKAKKYNYEGFDKAYANLLKLYEILSLDSSPTTETIKLKEACIDYWKIFVQEVDMDNKKARVTPGAAAAGHYNMGLVYFFCGDFVLATEQFERAQSFDKTVVAGIMNWIYISKNCAERLKNQ